MTPYDHIRDIADVLTESHQHRERIREWDQNRNAKWRHHVTTQPGLLAQLYASVVPAGRQGDSGAATVPASRPPLALEALSRHLAIRQAVHRWCHSLDIRVRKSVESNIRALVGAAPTLDEDDAQELLTEMRQWRRWCAVLTGWEQLYRPAAVPCPIVDCGKTNTLRINLTNRTAGCHHCGATWGEDDGSIIVLGDYIRSRTDTAA